YVVDLGSGDGRTVITAAKKYGVRALGIEYNADMVALSKRNAEKEGVADRAQFMQGDIFQTDFSKATVLTLYLLPMLNVKLRPTILRMKPGTRVVSHAFSMDDWQPDQIETVEGRTAYLWIVPARVEGTWRWGGSHKYEMLMQQHFQQVEGLVKVDTRTAQFRNARLQGDRISFSVIEYSGMGNVQHDYTGRVNGDVMAGTVKRSDAGGEEKWSAKRVAGPDAAQRSAR
ncbi:MAG: methyltransferase, partial [Burkholderiales bacterium]|nr:methyltransferase [Burkholderiales bacterium]